MKKLLIFLSVVALIGCKQNNNQSQRVNGMKITVVETYLGQEGIEVMRADKIKSLGYDVEEEIMPVPRIESIAETGNEIFIVQLTVETKEQQFVFESPEILTVDNVAYFNPNYEMYLNKEDSLVQEHNYSELNYTVYLIFEVQKGERFSKFIVSGKEFDLPQPLHSVVVDSLWEETMPELPVEPTAIDLSPTESKEEDDQVFFIVEEMPEFPGGEEALRSFIAGAIKYPEIAQENGIQGKVYVTFVVNKDGSISDSRIARGVDPLLDNEALRVVNSLPKWKPGKQRGKPVRVSYTLPVIFTF